MSSERTSLAPMLLTGRGSKFQKDPILKGTSGQIRPANSFNFLILILNLIRVQSSKLLHTKMPIKYKPPIIGKTACMCASRHFSDKPVSKMCEPYIFSLEGGMRPAKRVGKTASWIFSSNKSAPADRKKDFLSNCPSS
jgi:hypothetical protein